MLEWPQLSEY